MKNMKCENDDFDSKISKLFEEQAAAMPDLNVSDEMIELDSESLDQIQAAGDIQTASLKRFFKK